MKKSFIFSAIAFFAIVAGIAVAVALFLSKKSYNEDDYDFDEMDFEDDELDVDYENQTELNTESDAKEAGEDL